MVMSTRKIIKRFTLLIIICLQYVAANGQVDKDHHKLYKKFFPHQECDERAFRYGWKGYETLLQDSLLGNARYLTIIDYTKHSNVKRLFVLDAEKKHMVLSSITAHGIGSDIDSLGIPIRFSNRDNSHMTSLGFYLTGDTYTNLRKEDSLGLCLFGLDEGYNDAACAREIVIHYGASERSGNVYVTDTGAARSYGCPALPLSTNSRVINLIKGGSCLFVYSDRDKAYPAKSTVLNGGVRKAIVQRGPAPNYCTCNLVPKKR